MPANRKSTRRRRRSTRKRATSKRRRTPICQLCKKRLSNKIRVNMHEMKDKKRYVSQAQAVAVSFSQIKRKYPRCARCFRR